MARIDINAMKNWNNGDTMKEADYEQERAIVITAINDNYDRLPKQYKVLNPDGTVKSTQSLDTAINSISFKEGASVTLTHNAVTSVLEIAVTDGAVGTQALTDSSVTTAKIMDGSVTTIKLADGIITTAKIIDGHVTTEKIADLSIITGKLADLSVTNAKIASNAVSTDKLQDGSVTNAKIGDSQITNQKLASGSVDLNKLNVGSINTYYYNKAEMEGLVKFGSAVEKSTGVITGEKVVTVVHNLNTFPDVHVVAEKGFGHYGYGLGNFGMSADKFRVPVRVDYPDANQVVISMDESFSGTATATMVGTKQARVTFANEQVGLDVFFITAT